LYQVGSSGTGDRHLWLDANGKQLAQISEPGVFGATRLSPDGTRIVTPVLESSGEQRPWVWDIAGGTRARVSTASNNMDVVTWSADGRTIYYNVFDDKGHLFIRSVPADGSQPEHDLLNTADDTSPADVTRDGKWLLYDDSAAGVGAALKALPLVPGLTGFTVLDSVKFDSNARLRPGANDWLAYQSFQDGRSDIFVTRFPHPGAKYQVTQSAGTQPVWSADGKTLYYLDGSQKLVAVGLTFAGDSVQISPPKTLFPTGIRHSIPSDAYDVSRDGRFLVINSVNETDAPIVLVTNWPSDLKK
jgi:Tol biopolymer transport system component